jgi:hypothetical protein
VEHQERSGWKAARPVLLTTLVPVVAALGFFALATFAKHTPSIKNQPSMAAFDACLTAHDLQSTGNYPTQFDETVAAQQQMKTCGDKIPKKVLEQAQQKQQDSRRAAMASYRECIRNMAGNRTRGFGRFRGGPPSGFRDALTICRSLLQGGDQGPQQTTVPKAVKDKAPVA